MNPGYTLTMYFLIPASHFCRITRMYANYLKAVGIFPAEWKHQDHF